MGMDGETMGDSKSYMRTPRTGRIQKGRLLAACDIKQGGLARANALFMRIQFFHGYDRNMYGGALQKWLMHVEYIYYIAQPKLFH